jgi:DNA primase
MRVDIDKENEFYIECLFDKKIGKKARQYLIERNITKETAQFWKLGYSPNNMIAPIFDTNDMYKPWEKLQGRITIPIYDQNDNLISISGRLLFIDGVRPKYDHYPFPSRSILFGLSQNKEEIFKEDRCFLTEGQMDVISAWQKGVRTIVSSFGAHCSEWHLGLLSRYTNNITVLYDNDNAGRMGANKIKEFKKYKDLNINILNVLNEGEDLDNFFREHNSEDFENLLNKNNKENIMLQKIKMLKSLQKLY